MLPPAGTGFGRCPLPPSRARPEPPSPWPPIVPSPAATAAAQDQPPRASADEISTIRSSPPAASARSWPSCCIFVFLVWVVVPLFAAGRGRAAARTFSASAREADGHALHRRASTSTACSPGPLDADGSIHASSGLERLAATWATQRALRGARCRPPWAVGRGPAIRPCFGFADGTVRSARIGFATVVPVGRRRPAGARRPRASAAIAHVRRAASSSDAARGSCARQRLVVGRATSRCSRASNSALAALDLSVSTSAAPSSRRSTRTASSPSTGSRERHNMLTGEATVTLTSPAGYPSRPRPASLPDASSCSSGSATASYSSGRTVACSASTSRDADGAWRFAETLDLVGGATRASPRCASCSARRRLFVGDSRGAARASGSRAPSAEADADTVDGARRIPLVGRTRSSRAGSPVTALAPSQRSRLLAVGLRGRRRARLLRHRPSDLIAEVRARAAPVDAPSHRAEGGRLLARRGPGHRALGHRPRPPRGDASRRSSARSGTRATREPEHVWQSSGGTDDFEPKLGLCRSSSARSRRPSTRCSSACPIALLAAIFTSEFLAPAAARADQVDHRADGQPARASCSASSPPS